MGNPLKGEVSFVGSDNETRKLSYSAEALYRLEEQMGKRINAIAAEMQKPDEFSIATVRVLFWAGLLDTHDGLKLEEVGRIFSKISPTQAIELVTRAFNSAFGDDDSTSGASRPPAPGQDQPSGTGSAS